MTPESRAWKMGHGTYIEPGNGACQTLTMVEERTIRRCRNNILKICAYQGDPQNMQRKATALGYPKSLIFM